jgi:hypothetical protein
MTTLAEKRRARFERELCLYSIKTYNAPRIARALGKRVVDQPPYMPELRALYMAVRETYKGSKNGIGKGQTVNHMWPRETGAKKSERGPSVTTGTKRLLPRRGRFKVTALPSTRVSAARIAA